jgi:hypothetical protein
MNDNYLWDRSGEPDPEIQKLEDILGTLRYQPRALEIPPNLQVGRRRNFFLPLTIAATIAFVAVVLGLWFSFNRRQAPASVANNNSPVDQPAKLTTPRNPDKQVQPDTQVQIAKVVKSPRQSGVQKQREAPRNLQARNQNSFNPTAVRQPTLTPEELAEKEQVLVALRLVSTKLNLAQRRTQGGPQLNTIRNQHKIG